MPEAVFVPISPNPYIVGNPVRGRAMFFGRDAEFNLIRKRFEHSDHGGLLVFCGERRSGKTSILFQILDHRLGPAFIPVLIDMQSMAIGSEAEFLGRVSEEILLALGQGQGSVAAPDFSGESSRAATFARFVQQCLRAHAGRKLILLFDEYELFENKIDAGLLSQDVLNILAALMESASVFMVFTGSQHLEQRRRDYWSILGKSGYKTVSYLERDDAINLIRQPVEGRLRYDDPSVESILRLTAGQPFYTQAICQSLVDHLNDQRLNTADPTQVAQVVDGIINNPLPQMIFLWDGLTQDDKLVLALLAESLEDGSAHASVDALLAQLKRGEYPLELDRVRTATTLEKLYKTEMLLRSDREGAPEYAFRMDLWRFWIRRQHSVWQVMREEGLAIRKPRRPLLPILGAAGLVLGILAVIVVPRLRGRSQSAQAAQGLPAPGATPGFASIDVRPDGAILRMDGRRAGIGALRDVIAADVDHLFEWSAPGFADTAMTKRVASGDTLSLRVVMRELIGDLRVETTPPGAEVRVDGRLAGVSPLLVRGLGLARSHHVEAARDGYGVAHAEASLKPNGGNTLALALEMGKADVSVITEPAGGEIRVDGTSRGLAPVKVAGLSLGRHAFAASREGFDRAETTLVVNASTRELRFALHAEAPGVLVVRGDLPAQIYIDGTLVVENVQNSGPRSLPPGNHTVRVILVAGETIDHAVSVHSGERAIYDFSSKTVTRRPEGAKQP